MTTSDSTLHADDNSVGALQATADSLGVPVDDLRRLQEKHRATKTAAHSATREVTGNVVGKAIKRVRLQAGWSQAELAERVGMDQGHVARLESGRSQATTRTLQRIVNAIGKAITVRFEPS